MYTEEEMKSLNDYRASKNWQAAYELNRGCLIRHFQLSQTAADSELLAVIMRPYQEALSLRISENRPRKNSDTKSTDDSQN